jgi:hypothetical protein
MEKLFYNIYLYCKKNFRVLTFNECEYLGLYFSHNCDIIGILALKCNSVWLDRDGNWYRCNVKMHQDMLVAWKERMSDKMK